MKQTYTATSTLFSKTFALHGESGDTCYIEDFSLTAYQGLEVFGSVQSNGYVFFFIMTDSQFKQASKYCRLFASSPYTFSPGAVTSYSLD